MKTLFSILVALCAAVSLSAQDFEWGTATWNIEDGKTYTDIDDFNTEGVVLTYPNPADYYLTFLNVVVVNYDVYVDGATEGIAAASSAQANTAIKLSYDFVEGHSYKIVTNGAYLVKANLATYTTDTISTVSDSYTISFSIQGPELVKTYDVEGKMALSITDQEGDLTFSAIPTGEICTALGISDISEARSYGLNVNGSYNSHFRDYYDGWRDNAGEYTTYWGGYDSYHGHNAYKSVYCIKLNESCDTVKYYYYDYWKLYDPDAGEYIGGTTVTSSKHRAAPAVNYNKADYYWTDEETDSVYHYIRTYCVEVGQDYKASFIITANKKAVIINATLHFVSDEDYAAIESVPEYAGTIEQTLTHPAAGVMGTTTGAQTLRFVAAGKNLVNITFEEGFELPMAALGSFSAFTIENVATTVSGDTTFYAAGNFQVSMPKGSMTVNYNGTLEGYKVGDAAPVIKLTLANATTDTVYFGADQAAIDAYKAYEATGIETITATSAKATGKYLENGKVVIVNGNKKYSTSGAIIK